MSILVFTGINEQLVGKYIPVTCSNQKNTVHSIAIKTLFLQGSSFYRFQRDTVCFRNLFTVFKFRDSIDHFPPQGVCTVFQRRSSAVRSTK